MGFDILGLFGDKDPAAILKTIGDVTGIDSPDDLINLAKDNGIDLSPEQAFHLVENIIKKD